VAEERAAEGLRRFVGFSTGIWLNCALSEGNRAFVSRRHPKYRPKSWVMLDEGALRRSLATHQAACILQASESDIETMESVISDFRSR
jgi:hypothetical protein